MTDRSGVKQPIGQKFLTNVAVVRYRVKGQEYQVTAPPPTLSKDRLFYRSAFQLSVCLSVCVFQP